MKKRKETRRERFNQKRAAKRTNRMLARLANAMAQAMDQFTTALILINGQAIAQSTVLALPTKEVVEAMERFGLQGARAGRAWRDKLIKEGDGDD